MIETKKLNNNTLTKPHKRMGWFGIQFDFSINGILMYGILKNNVIIVNSVTIACDNLVDCDIKLTGNIVVPE